MPEGSAAPLGGLLQPLPAGAAAERHRYGPLRHPSHRVKPMTGSQSVTKSILPEFEVNYGSQIACGQSVNFIVHYLLLAVLYCTALHCTAVYCTVLYCTILSTNRRTYTQPPCLQWVHPSIQPVCLLAAIAARRIIQPTQTNASTSSTLSQQSESACNGRNLSAET